MAEISRYNVWQEWGEDVFCIERYLPKANQKKIHSGFRIIAKLNSFALYVGF